MFQKKFRFVAALAVLLVCGFLATSLLSYFVSRDSISQRIASESLPLTSDNVYSEIQRDLLRSVLISSMMAHDTFVREWAHDGEKDPQRIIRYLTEIRRKHHTITAFFVSERTRHYYHPDGVLKTVSRNEPIDAWYFRVRQMDTPYEINVDTDTADPSRLNIFVNYRVTDSTGKYLGAIGVGLAVDTVRNLIESYQKRFDRRIYFMDRKGKVTLYGSHFTGAMNIHDRIGLARHARRLLASSDSAFSYIGSNDDRVYLNARFISQFDWYLVVEQREGPAEAQVFRTLGINILISLFITVLVLILAHLLIRSYQRRLEAMATTDKLTGAANRHVFEMLFEQAGKAARRRGEPLSVISLDVDRFKSVNDHFGHSAGDAALKGLADVFRSQMRESDTLCRWGGDEFLILMPNSPVQDAAACAEKMRKAVHEHPIDLGQKNLHLTISLSVVQHRPDETLESLMHRIDAGLYRSKHAGRDQVSTEDPDASCE